MLLCVVVVSACCDMLVNAVCVYVCLLELFLLRVFLLVGVCFVCALCLCMFVFGLIVCVDALCLFLFGCFGLFVFGCSFLFVCFCLFGFVKM